MSGHGLVRPHAVRAAAYVLQAGASTRPTVVCMPGAGASVASWLPFAQAVGEDWPVIAVQPPGLLGDELPFTRIEDAVPHYLAAMRACVPVDRAVHLIGHSFGAWSIFEMARALRDQGRAALSVCLLDSRGPGQLAPAAGGVNADNEGVCQFIRLLALSTPRPEVVARACLAHYAQAPTPHTLRRLCDEYGLAPLNSLNELLDKPLRSFLLAYRTPYTPGGSYDLPVHLAQARNPHLDADDDQQRRDTHAAAWRRWAQRLVVSQVPGNHITLLKPAHAEALAAWWTKEVACAQ